VQLSPLTKNTCCGYAVCFISTVPKPSIYASVCVTSNLLFIRYVPSGKTTCLAAVIAACISAVSSVTPSPLAPKSFTDTTSSNLLSIDLAVAPVPDGVKDNLVASIAALLTTCASDILVICGALDSS
jgi:hypothetical protein